MTTARDALLTELLPGEDPNSPEYADAHARLERMLDDHAAEVLAEAAQIASTVIDRLSSELDTITAVARSNAECYRSAVKECQRLQDALDLARAVLGQNGGQQ